MTHTRISGLRPLLSTLLIAAAGAVQTTGAGELAEPINLGAGPHLFIDDHLIAEQSFLTRTVNQPKKMPQPVITGHRGGDDNFQPYMSVLRDPDSGRFRIWYNTPENINQSHIGYLESEDGISWIRPHRVLKDPQKIRFGVSVLDRGRAFAPADERYVLAFHEGDGMKIAVSADGLDWRMLSKDTVWHHTHDINALHWDPLRNRFIAIGSMKVTYPGEQAYRRIPHQSTSTDLLHWEPMWPIITPRIGAPIEQGEMQFYSMSGVITRGELMIGLVKVLRDDLNATQGFSAYQMGDEERKAAGLGYTVLAWTRDGVHWQRDDQPFIPNNRLPGRWDHAMAWGDEQIVVGNETYVYYAGYERGHKVERYDERQIGLAIMPVDRYAAREADLNTARLVTKPLRLNGTALTVNAQVVGSLRVRLLDEDFEPLADFDWRELSGDSPAMALDWPKPIDSLAGKVVRLEFELTNTRLFGLNLQ